MKSASSLFDEGMRLHADGRLQEALALFSSALQADPGFVPACLVQARLALEAGNADSCIATLERGLAHAPASPELLFRLGVVHQRLGNRRDALQCFQRIVSSDPDNAGAWLKLGILQGELGGGDAPVSIQQALLLRPQLRDAEKDRKLPEAMREEIGRANSILRRRYSDMVDATMDALRERFPGEDLHRIESAFGFLQGKPKRWCHPAQRPGFLLFPDMPARPWYEREEFDWVPRVEAESPAILEELAAIRTTEAGFAPYLHGVGKTGSSVTYTGEDFSVLADSMEWNAFHLMKAGERPENMARCPRTTSLMQSLPLARARDYMPEVFFSVLRPGAHIVPHYGQMNIRLTVHLGLVIPRDCGIRVHDETREWEPGKLLIFDDSFRHEAWNRSEEERVVLIFEVWHPDLREAEIFGIRHFLEQRGEWMARFLVPDVPSGSADA